MLLPAKVWMWAAVVLSGLAYVQLAKATWQSRHTGDKAVKPPRVSLTIWLIIDILLFLNLRSVGTPEADAASMAFLVYIVGSVALLVLAIPYGTGGFRRSDIACFILAMVSILVWKSSDNPQLALLMQITANVIACYPAMEQTWKKPWEADLLTWGLFLGGGVCNAFTVKNWAYVNWMTWLTPAHIVVLQILIILPLVKYQVSLKGRGWQAEM